MFWASAFLFLLWALLIFVVFVRVCAAVDTIFPGIGLGLKLPKDGANRFNIVSTSAFVYEPE